ncbi:MAG: permease [Ignavibacteriae bacterium]|nr:MAG: permease [Ignavibacteriota bacterium]
MKTLALSIPKDRKKVIIPLLLLPVWILIYFNLDSSIKYFVYSIINLPLENKFSDAVFFFIFESIKVLLLLVIVIFFISIIRSYFSPEKTRKFLEGKPLFAGNVLASMLGIVTPFCSCSAVPLFVGFVEAGIPLGITFSFLIAAPMINEVAVVLLFGLFGWQTALIYTGSGLIIAISAGYIIGKLKLNRFVEEWVYEVKSIKQNSVDEKISFAERIDYGYTTLKEIVSKVWIYILLGIAVGAGIHGYIPENFMAGIMGKTEWWSVPLSVLIGIPLYSNAAGIIPVMMALIEKGASLGTALAFMMSVIGLSLPEMIILRKVLKLQLIFIFIGVVGVGIIIIGFLFNIIY